MVTMKSASSVTKRVGGWIAAAVASVVMLATPAAASTITYYHNDLAGSPVVATNSSAQVTWRESYRPYGERLTKSAASKPNDVWFTSRRQDSTGLVYMGARYYDPVTGRFVSTDPKGFDEKNIQSFGRYIYGNNNPLKFVDPDGREPIFASTTSPNDVASSVYNEKVKDVFSAAAAAVSDVFSYAAQISILGFGGAEEAAAAKLAEGRTGIQVFRVFGGENSKGMGEWWTTVNPANVDNYREAAGLFPGNEGRFVIEGNLTNTSGVTFGKAAPGPGGAGGGLPEVIVPNAESKISVTRVSGVNPPM